MVTSDIEKYEPVVSRDSHKLETTVAYYLQDTPMCCVEISVLEEWVSFDVSPKQPSFWRGS